MDSLPVFGHPVSYPGSVRNSRAGYHNPTVRIVARIAAFHASSASVRGYDHKRAGCNAKRPQDLQLSAGAGYVDLATSTRSGPQLATTTGLARPSVDGDLIRPLACQSHHSRLSATTVDSGFMAPPVTNTPSRTSSESRTTKPTAKSNIPFSSRSVTFTTSL